MTVPAPDVRHRRRLPSWARIFLGGGALWAAAVVTTFVTGNVNLVPTIILVGAFLVPVTFVSYAFQRADGILTPQKIFSAFLYGGVMGVLGASVLEAAFVHNTSIHGFLAVGLIEEGVKLLVLWLMARRLGRYTVRDGLVLGATVGFGFAAFESAGYAFQALFTQQGGLSLLNVVETELLRGVLTPFGHGLWTAVTGAALFAVAARRGRIRLRSALVAGAYLLVSLLHALWDAAGLAAAWLTLYLTGSAMQRYDARNGIGVTPTPGQVHIDAVLNLVLPALDAVIGLAVIAAVIARVRRQERAAAIAR
ncbi:PrsW family intramembrane metalloprotease [Paractinoplanes rhizophilus]|uniref:PrsW family intramembrane metalloprotease n=1 Tax=Paractinoplanes rhizophilus TaxID=1416877 RepID=A0ABW2HNQ8_9ACTN|nr:PrsW family intramembrane metalloprotease [Actinoplanes sp.]